MESKESIEAAALLGKLADEASLLSNLKKCEREAELTVLCADIDRTANVVRALEAAFTSTQVRTNLAERIETEACMQEKRLVDLLARKRALMAPPDEQPSEVDVEAVAKALWDDGRPSEEWADQPYEIRKRWRESAQVAIAAMGKRPARDVGELLKDPLAVILTEVAGLVRIAGPDHFPDDAIPREPVVECAMRIRDARDAICSALARYRDGEKGTRT